MRELVPFTPKEVIKYLDNCIYSWRKHRDNMSHTKAQRLQAVYYVDAYQSVRTSLFGITLKKKIKKLL